MVLQTNYPDIRVVRTKSNLRDALVDLLQSKAYTSINVTDIAKKAGVNRVTFYNHYSSKDDLMVEVLDLLLEEYDSIIDRFDTYRLNSSPTIEQVIQIYYNHYGQYAKVYRIILSDEFPGYRKKFIEILQKSIHYVLSKFKSHPHSENEDYDFLIEWYVGGTLQTVQNYINTDKKISAETLARRMKHLYMIK